MSVWVHKLEPTLILDDDVSGRARCCNCYAHTHITARDCHWTELNDGCGIVFTQITSPWYDAAVCAQWRDDLTYVVLEWV